MQDPTLIARMSYLVVVLMWPHLNDLSINGFMVLMHNVMTFALDVPTLHKTVCILRFAV